MNIKKILLPLDLEDNELPEAVICQAGYLARHYNAEVVVLHVVRPLSYFASSEVVRTIVEKKVADQEERWKARLGSEFGGISVRRKVVYGDPAREIVRAAQEGRRSPA